MCKAKAWHPHLFNIYQVSHLRVGKGEGWEKVGISCSYGACTLAKGNQFFKLMNEIKRKPVTESKWGLCSEEGPVWLENRD